MGIGLGDVASADTGKLEDVADGATGRAVASGLHGLLEGDVDVAVRLLVVDPVDKNGLSELEGTHECARDRQAGRDTHMMSMYDGGRRCEALKTGGGDMR